jgi:hypothetical protein
LSRRQTTAPRGGTDHGEDVHPRGTLFLMLIFVVLIVAMWGYMYLMMLGRG